MIKLIPAQILGIAVSSQRRTSRLAVMNTLLAHRFGCTMRSAVGRLSVTSRVRATAQVLHSARNVRALSSAGGGLQDLITGMESKIKSALEAEDVEVIDNNGDGRHVQIHVVSSAFAGKSSVQRQRLVYKVRMAWRGLAMLRLHLSHQ